MRVVVTCAYTTGEHPVTRELSRRAAIRTCLALAARAAAATLLAPLARIARAQPSVCTQPRPHPAPRPGVTAARILPDARLDDDPAVRGAFADARRIPEVLDGIRCHCPCHDDPDVRSLLECFEGEGMARECAICRGQAQLAARLHRRGTPLADIRAAIDARYGDAQA